VVRRIKRSNVLPKFASNEALARRRYPLSLKLSERQAFLKYRVSKPYSFGEEGEQRIGTFELNE